MIITNTSRAYTVQDHLPPHPGSSWTRFVCISDTHSRQFTIPPGDVLLHAGDLSSWGYLEQLETTLEWLKTLDHRVKIITAGNHDLCLDERWKEDPDSLPPESVDQARALVRSQGLRDSGIYYLEHESLRFKTPEGREWHVYGSPAAPYYARGSFQYMTYQEANEIYARIPSDTEILLTHTPPHEVLDLTRRGKNAGCTVLSARMGQLETCRLHVFGHIHEANGAEISEGGENDIAHVRRISVNAALSRHGSPIVVDLLN